MNRTTVNRIVAAVVLSIGIVTATVFACGWMGTSKAVRFHSYQTQHEMGRLPPLPTLSKGINSVRVSWEGEYLEGTEEEPADRADEVWDRVEAMEKDGNLTELRILLKDYLARTEIERSYTQPTNRQGRRNSATDQLDALSALDHGSKASRVAAYLNARRLYELNTPDDIDKTLSQIGSDVNLTDNVAYFRAVRLYDEDMFEEATDAFSAVARRFPKSEKREVSLFLAAVTKMKTSAAYTPTSGDEEHLHEGNSAGPPHKVEIDKAWHEAFAGFKKLMAQYPRGRYFDDARGWLAYLLLRKGDRVGALVEYYRMLADKDSRNTRIQATFSLEFVRHHASDEQMSRVEKLLAAEPDAALAYAYHNIYNYSIDPGEGYPPFDPIYTANGSIDHDASWRQQEAMVEEWEGERELVKVKQLERTLNFSRELMERNPKLAIGGAFALRAAQANTELGRNEDAVQFAKRALQSGLNSEERKQALWTLGIAQHRLKDFSAARESLNTLLRDFPETELTEGARAHLAMIAEDAGDIDGALEQYFAIDYNVDAAYLIDVLMTHEQLAGFIERHPDSPRLNEVTYALGVRYLRSNRWDEARATFAKVSTSPASNDLSGSTDCVRNRKECVDPKEGDLNEQDPRLITTRLIMYDVQTANDMERMQRAINEAGDDEAKAEAMYQLASYQFEATTLLFYNPIAWSGGRYWNLSHFAKQNNFRAKDEAQTLFAYMQEHDTVARALKIYLEVADRFPNTRAARDSLYTAAVCHERLSKYNDYWRDIYGAGMHAGSRFVSYANVKAAYPSYQLPRGTFRWQPTTRTVNGGPGWASPPKPAPRPSRMARVKLLLEAYINPMVSFWNETGRQGLSLLTILIAMAFCARIATQNRKLLRPKLLRVRKRNAHREKLDPPDEMFWTSDPRDELWGRAKQISKKRLIEFWELAQDSNSRPVLVRNIVSHSFLVGLIVSLLYTLHFG